MALTRRAAMLSCLTAATISLFGGGVRPAAQQSGALATFADLFHEYRRGNVVLARVSPRTGARRGRTTSSKETA
jgi:hypothetical protein